MAGSTFDTRLVRAEGGASLRRILVLAAIIAIAIATAIGISLIPAPSHAAEEGTVVIKMLDDKPFYSPERATVRVGETVKWVNDGKTVHSVSDNATIASNPHDASKPHAAKAFDSGLIPPGGSFSYVFTVPGTYRYFCLPHEKAGMVGVIVVRR
ncbi:MAG TPA: plastocyanin/azurin family copper-binding protein [Candidatus Binataceae bacterium]|nr:plastocyanin/azurin family copper-binding protein [Candidatus Binataceae bacterium]